MALSQGNADVVQVLLSHGATLMGTLHKASSAGQVKMVAELLGRRADPGERDGEGRTALHLAVCRPEVVDMLVEARTPMTPDVSGKTPLHEVACKGSAMVAKSLLAAKADPTDKDMMGQTPLDIAKAELSKSWSHEMAGSEKTAEWF